MAVVGPRPQLVRDMVFMTPKQRRRHSVRPGLTGLAQINGRNEITWEEKLEWDLRYLDKITFVNDAKIVLRTIAKIRHKEGMNQPTVMLKKDDIEEVGGYQDWFCNEDYYLWIRLAVAGKKFANSPETLVNMRMSPDSYKRRGGVRYFQSEAKLQRYMLQKRVINLPTYIMNVGKRLIVQVLMPNSMRSWAFKNFARKKHSKRNKNYV